MKFIYGILTLAALAGMGWAAWNYLQLTEQAPGLNPWLLFTDANPMLKKLKMAAAGLGALGLLVGLVCAMRRPRSRPGLAPEIIGVLLALGAAAAGAAGYKYDMLSVALAEKGVGQIGEAVKAPGVLEPWLSLIVGLGAAGLILVLMTLGRFRKPKPRGTF